MERLLSYTMYFFTKKNQGQNIKVIKTTLYHKDLHQKFFSVVVGSIIKCSMLAGLFENLIARFHGHHMFLKPVLVFPMIHDKYSYDICMMSI